MSEPAHYLVFETGGTKLVAAVAGPDQRMVATEVICRDEADRAPKSFERIVSAAEKLYANHVADGAKFQAIGFGFGGTVRRSTNSPHLCLHEKGWETIDVAAELNARFGLPVYLENDCKLAALAEAHFGSGLGADTVFYVTLGTGVGGGLVRQGQIQQLGDIGEAEIGHIVVDVEGPPCWCGGRGCVESVCSGPGMSQLAKLLVERNPAAWSTSTLRSSGPAGSKAIIKAWQAQDGFASIVIESFAGYLAKALAAAINLMAPERVVIGGGLGTASPALLDLVRARTAPLVVPYFRDSYEILPSSLQQQVVTQGAAILAAQKTAGR